MMKKKDRAYLYYEAPPSKALLTPFCAEKRNLA